MSYYLTYEGRKIFVTDGENLILKVDQTSPWVGKSRYKFFINEVLFLECSYSSTLFSRLIKVEYKNFNKHIEFEKVGKRILLNYEHNYYDVVKKFKMFGKMNPLFKLFKNSIVSGEAFLLKKISFGGGTMFRIDFYSDDESNLFQVILFILKDQQSLIS